MKTVFCCQTCGYQAPKWMGRCPECEGWGTFVEEPADGTVAAVKSGRGVKPAEAVALDAIELTDERRIHTAIGEHLKKHITPVDAIFYVLEGTGIVEIGDEKLEVTKDTLIDSPAKIPHCWYNESDKILRILVTKVPKPSGPTKLL